MDNLQRSVDNVSSMDFTAELTQLKKVMSGVSLPTPAPVTQKPAPPPEDEPAPDPTPVIIIEETKIQGEITPLDGFISNPKGNGVELARKAIKLVEDYLKPGIKSFEVAEELEKVKTFISEKHKWIPALYEIGKVARQYKNKKDTPITQKDITSLKQEMSAWTQKL